MRNEDDRFTLGSESLDDGNQLLDLLRGQYGGRLVKNQNIAFTVQDLQNFNALLHADGDIGNDRVGVNRQAVALTELYDFFLCRFQIENAVFHGLAAENDVADDGEALHELKVLMHHADAERGCVARTGDMHGLAVDLDGAALGLIHSEQNAHQRRLARAVFAEQCMNLALADLQGDLIAGDDPGEGLDNILHLYSKLFIHS